MTVRRTTLVAIRSGRHSGHGLYIAPRSSLVSGVITRREWLRFMLHVIEGEACSCTPDKPHRHWLWQGCKTERMGYGSFRWRGRRYYAHQWAFIALGGALRDGYELDHLCRRGSCCNPACLELVTRRENCLRSMSI